ncbi:MAG TPA: HAD family hydrolase, partial [Acidimicrobiia bacterium]|nr:HAD family hydrolase [Acidimicrobiia bacterium]
MTLVDSRPGIAASLDALAAETGTHLDVDVIVGRLGARLEDELACWYPDDEVPAAADRYRAIYADVGV